MAYDTTLPLLKRYRSRKARDVGLDVEPGAPLSDYYFDPSEIQLLREIQGSDFSESLETGELEALRDDLQEYTRPYSPLLVPEIGRLSGDTYREALDHLRALIQEVYGKEEGSWVGYKNVWADEFVPPMASAFPGAKFLHIVRDPRAVAASKNAQETCYPWSFLGRQWRKLAGLAWIQSRSESSLSDRVLTVRFEDLIEQPVETAQAITSFLDVPFHENMVDPSTYVDGKGEPWKQNTSFGTGDEAFDQGAIDRWRKSLSADEQDHIERLCGPEMVLHGYLDSFEHPAWTRNSVLDAPFIPPQEFAEWIEPYVRQNRPEETVDLARETLRDYVLSSLAAQESVSEEIVRLAFLHPEVPQAAISGADFQG